MNDPVNALAVLALAVFLLGGAVWKFVHDRHMAAFGELAVAQVVDCVEKGPSGFSDIARTEYFPVVRFRTGDGRDLTAKVPYACDKAYGQPGLVVTVRYDVVDPENIEIATGPPPKTWPVVLWALGALGLGVFAVVALLG